MPTRKRCALSACVGRLAPHVGAVGVMDRDATRMRGTGPTVFAQVTKAVGVDDIVSHVIAARSRALGG